MAQEEQKLACPDCGKEFKASGLAMHRIRIHSNRKKWTGGAKGKRALVVQKMNHSEPVKYTALDNFKVLQGEDGSVWLAERIR